MIKKLRIGLFAFGTDGDIQPLIELAMGLFNKGHSIEMAIICLRNRDYSYLQKAEGFNVHVIPYPDAYVMKEFQAKEFWNFSESEFARYFDTQFNVVRNTIRRWANVLAKKVDLLVSIRMMYPVRFSAEKHCIPYVCLHFAHSFIKSKYYPPFGAAESGCVGNERAWQATNEHTNRYLLPAINKFREYYDLEPCVDFYNQVHHSSDLNLVAFSQHLLPADLDWEKNFHLCGYFKRDRKLALTDSDLAIQQFIRPSGKVIGVTFGSLLEYESEPAKFLTAVARVIRNQGKRAVILTNKDYGLVSDDQIYFATGYVNHKILFSKCNLVIHHGGAGTSHAVAEAGVPSLLVCYGFDQFSIGALLVRLGVCFGVMSRKNFNPSEFTALLVKALKQSVPNDLAAQLGNQLSSESGIAKAVNIIEEKYAQTSY